ncbi:MAG TPA: protein kinase [Pyrinomonadaceae bacterium]|jgi:serine/threonine protein kinase/cytochrome c-type biogenesis protein CcmH/NrfG
MEAENWEQVKQIFDQAINLPPENRATFIAKACAGDESLRFEVEELLSSYNTNFLEESPVYEKTKSFSSLSLFNDGQAVGHYKIRGKIGSGGMGEVFLAQDINLKRLVALKVLNADFSRKKENVCRFKQEARATSALNHPNILTIYEIGEFEGISFIASEYIKGETLRERLERGSLPLLETLKVALQIAAALKAAHNNGIIHRDIKPENIMLREDGIVKVVDFGVAKLLEHGDVNLTTITAFQTRPGVIIGTPVYMSPEQIEGRRVDHRIDIFSLGSLIYECLTGKPPFQGATISEITSKVVSVNPPPPSVLNFNVSPELDEIVLKLLKKKPEERYQSAADLISDLDDISSEVQAAEHLVTRPMRGRAKTSPIKVLSTLSKFVEKPRNTILFIAGLILISLAAYYLFSPWVSVQPKNEAVRLFVNGTEAIRDGTYFKASKMLEDAVKVDNDFILARARLAEVWTELDYIGRAQNEVLKVSSLQQEQKSFLLEFSKSDDALYIEAVNATVLRDFQKAVAAYEAIAQRHPERAYVFVDLGRAYEKQENIDKALESYEKAANLDSQYGAAFLRLGILRGRKADSPGVNEAFDSAEKIYDRQSNDEGVAEVKFQRGVFLNNQEKLAAARDQFEQVLKMPRANKYQQIKATLKISQVCYSGGDTACAEEYAMKGIDLAKDERMLNLATDGLIDLGNTYLARAQYDKAEQYFQQALEFARKDEVLPNEARALLSLGNLRIEQKNPNEAESFIRQALPFFQKGGYSKQVSQANILLGRATEMKGDYDAALQAFEQVENSKDVSAFERAYAKMVGGDVLTQQEKYPEALDRFKQSYDLFQSLDNPYITYTAFYLSDVLYELGRFEEAANELSKARARLKEGDSLIPTLNIKTHLINAQIALSRQNFTEAVKEAQQVKVSKSASDAFVADKVICLAQTGFNSKGLEGVQSCHKALQYAESTKNSRTINIAKLALAEAYLNTGSFQESLDLALQTKDYFVNANQFASGWRAWLIAALASQKKGDQQNAKDYSAKALETLFKLRENWGAEHFNVYLAKPDVQSYYTQADNLSKAL